MTDGTTLGDRMKAYESAESARRLAPDLPILARIDGRAFSTFTRGLARPYDERMSACMVDTTRYLVEQTGALLAHTQSDEINLLLHGGDDSKEVLFDGRVLKLTSVLAALATVEFNRRVAWRLPDYADRRAVFDCRVWTVPNEREAYNAFLWREQDATRNSISMAARACYPAQALFGRSAREMRAMLLDKGIDWQAYPASFRRGVFVRRRRRTHALTPEQTAALPEKHLARGDADFRYERWVIEAQDVPALATLVNPLDFLFRGATPETGRAADADPPQ